MNPFRKPEIPPVYPKDETAAERTERLNKEAIEREEKRAEKAKQEARHAVYISKRNSVLGTLGIFFVPSAACMAIGYCWNWMNAPIATASIIASSLFSLGIGIAIGVGVWGKE